MDDESGLLRRRLDREHRARKEAERIIEQKSRELYERSEELQRAVVAEHRARGDAEALRDAVESFTARLDPDEVIRHLQRFLTRLVPHGASAVYLLSGEGHVLAALERNAGDPEEQGGAAENPDEGGAAAVELPECLAAIRQATRPIVVEAGCAAEVLAGLAGDAAGVTGAATPLDGTAWLAAPLLARGEYTGFVLLGSGEAGAFDETDARLAQALANEAAVALQNAHLFQEVERLSATDPLTGLSNRRCFAAAARTEFERSTRYDLRLSAVMLDLDHFKDVNDTHGHAAGDTVLVQVAGVCLQQLREPDIHARYGGEELRFLLPETSRDGALVVAERMREAIAGLCFDAGANGFSVTASLGVAERGGSGDTLAALLRRSDEALYEAKRAGRDRVVFR